MVLTGGAKIQFRTVDISEIVPAVSTSIGAIVLFSNRGDTTNPKLITNKAQFIEEYGKPEKDGTSYGHYSALGFLERGSQLYAYRVHNGALHGGIEIVQTGASEDYNLFSPGESDPTAHSFDADGIFVIYAANPGSWNSKIKVKVETTDASNKEFKISIYVTDDDNVDNLEETFTVSRQHKLDGFGTQMYLEDKINGVSKYIKVKDNTSQTDTVMPKDISTAVAFTGGTDGSTITDTQFVTGWGKFENKEKYPINILINAGRTGSTVQAEMMDVAEARTDCFAILDAPLASIQAGVSTLNTWRDDTLNENSSFGATYSPWIKIFDEYNGMVVTVPPSGHIAAVYAYTDEIYGAAHGAPAGYTRGILRNALDLSQDPYTEGEKDSLQDNQVNPIIKDSGYGIVVFGEDTLLTKKSALSNVHVRRLINQVSVQTTLFAKPFLFEPLLERTFFRVRTALEQYMTGLQGLGAFDDVDDKGWKVVCDSTNNTANDRDNNQMNVWIFIKPVKVAKYIVIKGIITRSSSSFNAVVEAGIV